MALSDEVFKNRNMAGVRLTSTQGDIAVGSPLVAQTAHGFSLGDIVRQSDANDYVAANASSVANVGLGLAIVIAVPDANSFTLLRFGNSHTLNWASHGFGAFGTKLYLQDAGGLGTAVGTVEVYCGYVRDANHIVWEPGLRYIY